MDQGKFVCVREELYLARRGKGKLTVTRKIRKHALTKTRNSKLDNSEIRFFGRTHSCRAMDDLFAGTC